MILKKIKLKLIKNQLKIWKIMYNRCYNYNNKIL